MPTFAGAVFVTKRSAELPPVTWVVATPLLFSVLGSSGESTFTMLVMKLPGVAPGGTCTVSVKVEVALATKLAIEQLTVPVPPTPGLVQLKDGPVFWRKLTNVVP